MFSACRVAKRLEQFIPEFIQLEHKSNVWKVKETSATDIVIATFKHWCSFQVHVDGSNEAATGADLEILFNFPSGKSLIFFIQCKRADLSSSIRRGAQKAWSYKELFHKNATGLQIDQLLNHCKTPGRIPLYAFFHSEDSRQDLGIGTTGIQIIHARFIVPATTPKRNKLATKHYAPHTSPLHTIFCHAENCDSDADKYVDLLKNTISGLDVTPQLLTAEQRANWLSFGETKGEYRSSARMIYSVPQTTAAEPDGPSKP